MSTNKEQYITPMHVIGGTVKYAVLVIASIFTAFPFFWMIVSALKTKAEIMSVSSFLPSDSQWGNFISVIFDSPILHYVWNSMLISLIVVALQMQVYPMQKFSMAVTFNRKVENS